MTMTMIIALMALIVTLISNLFPKFFPSVGNLLLKVKTQSWIVLVLSIVIIGQLAFILIRL